ncbi:MAG: glycosyltransferase family 4 protein [Candidatus Aminicenantes bacterium]|nr:glycosyltransferase family 4 protein [Candidatus Aminicenantes bacterium]
MIDKIVVVHLITKLELGGAQLNTLHTVENLDPLRFDSYLLCGPGGMLRSSLRERHRLMIVPALEREIRPGRDLRAIVQLTKLFKDIGPQIVHTHSSKAGILGRWAAFLAGVPVIVHSVHGFSFSPYQSFLRRHFYLLAEKVCRRLTSHFVFVAAADIELARRHRLIGDNFSLIRSGFPLEKFASRGKAPAALKEKYGLPASSFVCGVLAPFKPQKGLFHLAAIAALVIQRHPQVFFFIAGDGGQRQELEEELRRLNIEGNFRLPGFIRDVETVMDFFDIGVSTSLWEGLPQSLVQLRLKKKAVVASDIPGNREVIRDGENGFLFPVEDHDRFAAAILRLATDTALRRKLGNFAGDDFHDWSADVLVARQEELYQRLLVQSWTSG